MSIIVLSDSNDSINDVLGVEYIYEVPLYQRRYVWNETNWQTLWDDILDQEKIDPAGQEEGHEGHFTGPMVTRCVDEEQNRYEVIDGQQRLTTLEIIFCVIRDLCSGLSDLYDEATIDDAEQHVLYDPNDQRIPKLIPTKYDRSAFQGIVNKQYGQRIHEAFDENAKELNDDKLEEIISEVFDQKQISRSILDAYKYFYEEIRNHLQGNPDTTASSLINAITSDFKLIHLTLGDTEQAEKVFESINATGRLLSNFDYLRNNLFLRARKLGIDEESGEFYRDLYYNDSNYWPFENESNYWDREKLESFLQAFLMARWNPECFKKEDVKSFEEYRKYSKSLEDECPRVEDRIPYEFKELSQWASSYRGLRADQNFNIHERFCKDLNLHDLDSFLLFINHNHEQELGEVCWSLRSYIVRRMLVLENAAHSHKQIIEDSYKAIDCFFSSVVSGAITFSKNSFAKCLHNSNGGWPDNKDVKTAFRNVNSKNADFIAYMFYQMTGTEEQQYGQEPLNWGKYMELSKEIADLLTQDDEYNSPVTLFSHIWPEPFYFIS